MKIKKATKRLEEIEELLASIIDRGVEVDAPQRAILQEMKDKVSGVKTALLATGDNKAATPPAPPTKHAVRRRKKPAVRT